MSDQEYVFSQRTFQAWDYVVFGVLLLLSSVIGLYFGWSSRKKTANTEDYLLAGRSMGVWPVALSLLASFMSALTLLGTPAEIALYGTQYWMLGIGYIIVILVTNQVFLPVFYRLNITSVFEVKLVTTLCFILHEDMVHIYKVTIRKTSSDEEDTIYQLAYHKCIHALTIKYLLVFQSTI